MFGYPFDSQVTFESDGTPIYDRALDSASYRKLLKKLISNGIVPNPSDALQVGSGSGMTVNVSPGFIVIQGAYKLIESRRTLAVQASNGVYDRIDTVVMRFNNNTDIRDIDLYIVTGVPATTPKAPNLTRNESVYEMGLANLFIARNSTAITQQRITDTRLDANRCGIASAIAEFDTTALYDQIQAALNEFSADFNSWFDDIKGTLTGDVATNLTNQIYITKTDINGM